MLRIEKSEVIRRPYLDGLRGVAACIVFFAHLMIAVMPAVVTFSPSETHFGDFDAWLGQTPVAWIWNGEFAVCIFFVLSGFVLSEFAAQTSLSFPAMVLRRYLRLALPMLITSFLAYVIMVLGLYKTLDASQAATKSGWLSMWYRGFEPSFFGMAKEALYSAFVEGRALYNSNLWTMRIELIGSVYVYVIHCLFRNLWVRTFVFCLLLATQYNNFYALFAVGALLSEHEARVRSAFEKLVPDHDLRQRMANFGILFSLYLGAYPHIHSGMVAQYHAFLPTSVPTLGWHMMASVGLVLSLLSSSAFQNLLSGRIGRWLGSISFVLYLIHLPIICSLTAWTAWSLAAAPYGLNLAVTITITAVAVFLFSHLLYTFVDTYTTGVSRWAGKSFDRIFKVPGKNTLETKIAIPAEAN